MDGSDHTHDPVQYISPGPYPPDLLPHGLGTGTMGSLSGGTYRKARKSTACVKYEAKVFKYQNPNLCFAKNVAKYV